MLLLRFGHGRMCNLYESTGARGLNVSNVSGDLLMLSNVTLDEQVLPATHGQLKPPLRKHHLKHPQEVIFQPTQRAMANVEQQIHASIEQPGLLSNAGTSLQSQEQNSFLQSRIDLQEKQTSRKRKEDFQCDVRSSVVSDTSQCSSLNEAQSPFSTSNIATATEGSKRKRTTTAGQQTQEVVCQPAQRPMRNSKQRLHASA